MIGTQPVSIWCPTPIPLTANSRLCCQTVHSSRSQRTPVTVSEQWFTTHAASCLPIIHLVVGLCLAPFPVRHTVRWTQCGGWVNNNFRFPIMRKKRMVKRNAVHTYVHFYCTVRPSGGVPANQLSHLWRHPTYIHNAYRADCTVNRIRRSSSTRSTTNYCMSLCRLECSVPPTYELHTVITIQYCTTRILVRIAFLCGPTSGMSSEKKMSSCCPFSFHHSFGVHIITSSRLID